MHKGASVGLCLEVELTACLKMIFILANAHFLGWTLLDCTQSRKDKGAAFLPPVSEM